MAGRLNILYLHLLHRFYLIIHDHTEHHSAVQPQHVRCAQNKASRGKESNPAAGMPRSNQDQDFANETAGSGQTNRRKHHKHKKHSVTRHHRCNTAVSTNLTRVEAVINNTNAKEQCSRYQTMTDHLEHCTGNPLLCHGENTNRHKTHMRNR